MQFLHAGPVKVAIATLLLMEQRALVLGGGGVTGIAWELGIVAGLHDAGIDLTAADLVVGTSAGELGAMVHIRVAIGHVHVAV